MDFLSDVHCKPLAIFSTLRLFITIDPPVEKNITMRKTPVNHLLKCTYVVFLQKRMQQIHVLVISYFGTNAFSRIKSFENFHKEYGYFVLSDHAIMTLGEWLMFSFSKLLHNRRTWTKVFSGFGLNLGCT